MLRSPFQKQIISTERKVGGEEKRGLGADGGMTEVVRAAGEGP